MVVSGELYDGEQSRVFDVRLGSIRLAAKLTDRRVADRTLLETRATVAEHVGATHIEVVGPTPIDGSLVQPIGAWLMSATPYVGGARPSAADPGEVAALGEALARLHTALSDVPEFDLPPVAALAGTDRAVDRTGWQLLHGDFSTKNVLSTSRGLRIIDFDDCGYGPAEYDVANSLYMELFDATVNDRPERYAAFRPAFLSGYRSLSTRNVADAAIDEMIDARVAALDRWLDDLATAPIGIRFASPDWHATLADFVRSHHSSTG